MEKGVSAIFYPFQENLTFEQFPTENAWLQLPILINQWLCHRMPLLAITKAMFNHLIVSDIQPAGGVV